MTQDEILTRAREAFIKAYASNDALVAAIRAGRYDDHSYMEIAIAALTDAHRPLSEIVPVDPDLLAAREWAAKARSELASAYLAGELDYTTTILGFLAGCRHARGEGA